MNLNFASSSAVALGNVSEMVFWFFILILISLGFIVGLYTIKR